jgi:hypothetical protein
MGSQEYAFRSAVDVIVATPGRLLDHFRYQHYGRTSPRHGSKRRRAALHHSQVEAER